MLRELTHVHIILALYTDSQVKQVVFTLRQVGITLMIDL